MMYDLDSKFFISYAISSLGRVNILLEEMRQGYPEHFYWVIGHLNAAACDLVVSVSAYKINTSVKDADTKILEIANSLRQERLKLYEDRNYYPNVFPFIDQLKLIIAVPA